MHRFEIGSSICGRAGSPDGTAPHTRYRLIGPVAPRAQSIVDASSDFLSSFYVSGRREPMPVVGAVPNRLRGVGVGAKGGLGGGCSAHPPSPKFT